MKKKTQRKFAKVRKLLFRDLNFHTHRFKWVGWLTLALFGLITVVYSRAMSWNKAGSEVNFWQGWPSDWLYVTIQYPINEPFGLEVLRSIRLTGLQIYSWLNLVHSLVLCLLFAIVVSLPCLIKVRNENV